MTRLVLWPTVAERDGARELGGPRGQVKESLPGAHLVGWELGTGGDPACPQGPGGGGRPVW